MASFHEKSLNAWSASRTVIFWLKETFVKKRNKINNTDILIFFHIAFTSLEISWRPYSTPAKTKVIIYQHFMGHLLSNSNSNLFIIYIFQFEIISLTTCIGLNLIFYIFEKTTIVKAKLIVYFLVFFFSYWFLFS